MLRRQLIKQSALAAGTFSVATMAGWYHFFDGSISNPCLLDKLPDSLVKHELMQVALEGLDMTQLWDCHFHIVGNGLNPDIDGKDSGVWLNPNMSSWFNPMQHLQYEFYMNAACIEEQENADQEYIQNIRQLLKTAPKGIRFMLLAFDYHHNDQGQREQNASTFYIPNEYAARLAASNDSFEWIASIHPYREDALEQLDWCAQNGARAVKWLPPAMNIDPSSKRCDDFYDRLVALSLPLLTHAGEERAIHSEKLQGLSNPLLLRRPLEQGVKVIIAHCASLGQSEDFETSGNPLKSNFALFTRLMNDKKYTSNLLADISALNLFNRETDEVRQVVVSQEWHERLLYGSDFPLPGVMPIISSTNLSANGLLDKSVVPFLNQVRQHNTWLFDFLQKRFLTVDGKRFSDQVFSTRRHFKHYKDKQALR